MIVELFQNVDIELADTMLAEWYDISKKFRMKLGYPSCSSFAKNAKTSRQYDDICSITSWVISKEEYWRIDHCVNQLPIDAQGAIGVEMKNRQVRRKVWRSRAQLKFTYGQALDMIVPLMQSRGLLD